jgi:hypothetical protein
VIGLPESWINGIQQWAEKNSSIREVWLLGVGLGATTKTPMWIWRSR